MPANLKNSAVVTGLEKFSLHSNPKEGQCQRTFKLPWIALIPLASKAMIKILRARLQQYVNGELPDEQAGFRKGRRNRDQITNILQIIERAREFHKNIYFCFIDYPKTFDCLDHNKLLKILSESESHWVMFNFLQPHDYTVRGILQARMLEWVAFPFPRGSSQHRDRVQVSCIADGFFTSWTTREVKKRWE